MSSRFALPKRAQREGVADARGRAAGPDGAGRDVHHVHETRQMEELTLEKAQLAAAIGARQYGDILDGAIDSGALTVNDVFDRQLRRDQGLRLGDEAEVPHALRRPGRPAALVFQDKFLDHQDFVFAVGVDENGYLPTHNTPLPEAAHRRSDEGPRREPDEAHLRRPGRARGGEEHRSPASSRCTSATPARRCGTCPRRST